MGKVEIGPLKVDRQIGEAIPCHVSARVLQAQEIISTGISNHAVNLMVLGIGYGSKEQRPGIQGWGVRDHVRGRDSQPDKILR
jgi:hypothetical protein